MNKPSADKAEKKQVRCAIYTRKSSEEGLAQEFNSLDAQRESAEAYIASQKGEGWVCLPDRYDDGGFTGGNMERPAVQCLMADIEEGKIDCVIVYKVDRLSRSLLDFARMMSVFEKHQISFVSVTQQFNTTQSMGRLTLNILLSFAQFEREIISERTRDKIAAARRKGKYAGGTPVLGYDVLRGPTGSKLVVNEAEATRVRAIFELYLKHEALIPTVTELDKRGWTTKRWGSRKGTTVGGRPFDKCTLFKVLTNVIYLGKVRYRDEIHAGEHAAIVDEAIWQRVQSVLQRNGRTGGALVRNRHGALLKGLLSCASCRCSMGHSYSSKGAKRYRYYVCLQAQKRGWHTSPTKSVSAGEIEVFVIQQIKSIGRDPAVLAETLRQAREQRKGGVDELEAQERALQRELVRHNARLGKLAAGVPGGANASELADLHDRIRAAERRLTEVLEQIAALGRESVDETDLTAALSLFDPLWETLSPREQARIIRLLVERVDYDGIGGSVSITFRQSGIKTLAQQNGQVAA
jgi:site-specific DNA recombinase